MEECDYLSLLEFRFHIRRFLKFSEEAARARGLEPQQHQALLVIKCLARGDEVSARDLAERLLIRHHSAVELIDRIESQGLVKRLLNPADHRSVLLRLTGKGAAIIRELSVHHRRELRNLAPALIRTLRGVLQNTDSGRSDRKRCRNRLGSGKQSRS